MLFGHIYKEFKVNYSYFDILKMILKLFIISVLNIQTETYAVTSVMIITVLIFYLSLFFMRKELTLDKIQQKCPIHLEQQ
jgi:hypothetical protein